MRNRFLTSFVVLGVLGCHSGSGGAGAGGATTATCSPSDPTCFSFSHTFSTQTVAPGQEIQSLCQIYTLNNPAEIWVNGVTLDNQGAYHHSNWFFVPNTDSTYAAQPDGAWDCSTFDEISTALAGGVLYAQSTQVTHEVQAFPPGTAVRIPPWSRIVGQTHLLNTSTAPVTTSMTLGVASIPAAQVTVKLAPFQLIYHDLHLPPKASSDFSASCDFAGAAQAINEPFSFHLYYVLPHYHLLGTGFSFNHFGGPSDGVQIASAPAYNAEPDGKAFDPAVDMTQDKGASFRCAYDNTTASEVTWGLGGHEMCEMLGFSDSSLAFVGEVNDGTGMVTGMAGGTVQNSGPCSVTALHWDQNKPGGMPPAP